MSLFTVRALSVMDHLVLQSLVLICAVMGLSLTAEAQATVPNSMFYTVPAPDQSHAIELRTATEKPAQTEQWEHYFDERIVRNVSVPTLTPVLPDTAKATGTAVIVAPGGGFLYLSMEMEGEKVARWLADHGIAAFILKYRTRETARDNKMFRQQLDDLLRGVNSPNHDVPEAPTAALEDAKAAVALVRERASAWHIDPARVGFVGFSAGAIIALATGLTEDPTGRPDFIAPIYGNMKARTVPPYAPPMFVALALDDPIMGKNSKLDLIESWRSAGRSIEVHLYQHGGHGFGMRGHRPASALWIEEFYAWMEDCGYDRS